MFLFKSNKIVVDAFTTLAGAAEYNPIQPSIKFLPDWWRKTPTTYDYPNSHGLSITHSTIKRCDGINALYTKGFMVPLWCDMKIYKDEQTLVYQFADKVSQATSHNRDQFPYGFEDVIHMKIESPWYLHEKTGVDFIWFGAVYNTNNHMHRFNVLPGVLNYKNMNSANINLFMSKHKDEFIISAGTPMAQVIPMSDKKVEIRCHQITQDEYDKRFAKKFYNFKFSGSYRERNRIVENKSKCPFGFGKK